MINNNLELGIIEYKALKIIKGRNEILDLPDQKIDLSMDIFPQTWPTTSTAFCYPGVSEPTTAYTVIVKDSVSNTYVVFVDGTVCFTVTNPTDEFYKDVKNHDICHWAFCDKYFNSKD